MIFTALMDVYSASAGQREMSFTVQTSCSVNQSEEFEAGLNCVVVCEQEYTYFQF